MITNTPTLPSQVANYNTGQYRAMRALRERRMFKLICGATYSDFDSVAKYSEIFARAGAHIVDICAHPTVVTAAKEGILRANVPENKQPIIMVSLSLDHQHDPHFRRVALDSSSCDTCGACIPTCPTQAFSIKDGKLSYAKERCYGCGACVPICHVDALTPEPVQAFQPAILPELWELGARCLEIHVGPNFYWLEPYLQKIREISPQPWMVSVCIGSGFASYSELKEQAEEIYNILGDGTLIQVDGKAMSGFVKEDSVMLQSLAAAQAVLEVKLPLYVQVSGGINDRIRILLDQFGLKTHGVGIGSYAKKQIEPYLNDIETAVQIASKLVQSVKPL
ncbi:MAG: LdpA C-terminal domain-containing domain [Candidatus Caenarcaniphilales bacterium]|nr:LdpA C-terminal domain-containing domain [Candidatus Caenarcaniphilales bacterium]